jgi:hypothetical protein
MPPQVRRRGTPPPEEVAPTLTPAQQEALRRLQQLAPHIRRESVIATFEQAILANDPQAIAAINEADLSTLPPPPVELDLPELVPGMSTTGGVGRGLGPDSARERPSGGIFQPRDLFDLGLDVFPRLQQGVTAVAEGIRPGEAPPSTEATDPAGATFMGRPYSPPFSEMIFGEAETEDSLLRRILGAPLRPRPADPGGPRDYMRAETLTPAELEAKRRELDLLGPSGNPAARAILENQIATGEKVSGGSWSREFMAAPLAEKVNLARHAVADGLMTVADFLSLGDALGAAAWFGRKTLQQGAERGAAKLVDVVTGPSRSERAAAEAAARAQDATTTTGFNVPDISVDPTAGVTGQQVTVNVDVVDEILAKVDDAKGAKEAAETGQVAGAPAPQPAPTPSQPAPAPKASPEALDFVMPEGLRRSNPRYRNSEIAWNSDLDKALYIVRNRTRLSKSDAKFMDVLRKHFPGESDDAIRARGDAVLERIKATGNVTDEDTLLHYWPHMPEVAAPASAAADTAPPTASVPEEVAGPPLKPETPEPPSTAPTPVAQTADELAAVSEQAGQLADDLTVQELLDAVDEADLDWTSEDIRNIAETAAKTNLIGGKVPGSVQQARQALVDIGEGLQREGLLDDAVEDTLAQFRGGLAAPEPSTPTTAAVVGDAAGGPQPAAAREPEITKAFIRGRGYKQRLEQFLNDYATPANRADIEALWRKARGRSAGAGDALRQLDQIKQRADTGRGQIGAADEISGLGERVAPGALAPGKAQVAATRGQAQQGAAEAAAEAETLVDAGEVAATSATPTIGGSRRTGPAAEFTESRHAAGVDPGRVTDPAVGENLFLGGSQEAETAKRAAFIQTYTKLGRGQFSAAEVASQVDDYIATIKTAARSLREGNIAEAHTQYTKIFNKLHETLDPKPGYLDPAVTEASKTARQRTGTRSSQRAAHVQSWAQDPAGYSRAEQQAIDRVKRSLALIQDESGAAFHTDDSIEAFISELRKQQKDLVTDLGGTAQGVASLTTPVHSAWDALVGLEYRINRTRSAVDELITAFPEASIQQNSLYKLVNSLNLLGEGAERQVGRWAKVLAAPEGSQLVPAEGAQAFAKGRKGLRIVAGEGAAQTPSARVLGDWREFAKDLATYAQMSDDILDSADNQIQFNMLLGIFTDPKISEGAAAMHVIGTGLGGAAGWHGGGQLADELGLEGGARFASQATTALGGALTGGYVLPRVQRGLVPKGKTWADPKTGEAFFMNSILQSPRSILKAASGAFGGAQVSGFERAVQGAIEFALGNRAQGAALYGAGTDIMADATRELVRLVPGDTRSLIKQFFDLDMSTPQGRRQFEGLFGHLPEIQTPEGRAAFGKMLEEDRISGRMTNALVGKLYRSSDNAAIHIMTQERRGVPGISFEDAQNFTLTGRPVTEAGQGMLRTFSPQDLPTGGGGNPFTRGLSNPWLQSGKRLVSAVPRVGINMAEQGLMRTVAPIAQAGETLFRRGQGLPALPTGRGTSRPLYSGSLAEGASKALTGGLGIGAGYGLSDKLDWRTQPLVTAMAGPLAVPFMLGAGMREGAITGKSMLEGIGNAFREQVADVAPIDVTRPLSDLDPQKIVPSTLNALTPAIAKDALRWMDPGAPQGRQTSPAAIRDAYAGGELDEGAAWLTGGWPPYGAKGVAALGQSLIPAGPWGAGRTALPPKPVPAVDLFGEQDFDPFKAPLPIPFSDRDLTRGWGEPSGRHTLHPPTHDERVALDRKIGAGPEGLPTETGFMTGLLRALENIGTQTLFPTSGMQEAWTPYGTDPVLREPTQFGADYTAEGVRPVAMQPPSARVNITDPETGLDRPLKGISPTGQALIRQRRAATQNVDPYLDIQFVLNNPAILAQYEAQPTPQAKKLYLLSILEAQQPDPVGPAIGRLWGGR